MAPLTSVVIPARNAAATLGAQLEALSRQDHTGAWEVVLVDDRSSDSTVAVAEAWADRLPTLRVVTGDGRGVSRARNLGVAAAQGGRVLLCDADDVVAPAWVRSLTAALEDADVAGGPLDMTVLNPWRQRTRPATARTKLPVMLGHLPYAVGCNVGFRRALFDALGGFDESFPPGSEDADFSWRAQAQGFALVFCPDAVVHYRLRPGLRALARQQYAYARGAARLRAVHTRSGALPPQPPAVQARRLGSQAKGLLRLQWLFDRQRRWDYVRSLGWLAGTVRGLLTERVVA
jgi:glycosyltransferase involved in cell wall biosynthesis